jgi:two-component system, NarL family, nitrate/nitrite response regulator NarL
MCRRFVPSIVLDSCTKEFQMPAIESTRVRLLVADDHDLIRDMVEGLVEDLADDLRVYHAGTLPQALDLARSTSALDLILLDVRMPGMNGLAGLKTMREARPDVPIIVMSGDTDPETARGALQAGAAGFIPKTMRAAAMLNALRLVLSGGRYIPEQAMGEGHDPSRDQPPGFESLTPRELDVLRQLVKGQSNKEIGRELQLSEVTIGLRLRSIYRKLGVKSRTQAVRLALRQGLDS